MIGRQPKSWLAWFLLLAVVLGLLAFAVQLSRPGPNTERPSTHVEGETGWPRTLVERAPDGTERRRLILRAKPQRIVSVALATDEILMDLVEPERIVALSTLAARPGSSVAGRVGPIQHFVSSDVESIIALEPDLCFLASYNRAETCSLLIDAGIPVFVFHSFRGFADIRKNIRSVGRAVGEQERAERLVAEMDRKISAVAEQVPPREQWPSALVFDEGGWVAGSGTTQTDILEAAGLRNIAVEVGVTGFVQVSEEQLLDLAPDYIVIAKPSLDMADQKAWLQQNPALARLEAIREERFLTLPARLLSTVSHHIGDAVVELARQVYPNRFSGEQ
jgi:iron complex transport system substrate-binding protein